MLSVLVIIEDPNLDCDDNGGSIPLGAAGLPGRPGDYSHPLNH